VWTSPLGVARRGSVGRDRPPVDPVGNVLIADPGTQRVREVSNGTISTVAGTGKAGYTGDGGPATQAELNHPFGVGVDPNDNLFIADSASGHCHDHQQ